LWQSMQSIARTTCFAGSSLNSLVRNSVTFPFSSVTRTYGIFLALRIGGNVFDFIRHVHVPVDSTD
jgi:hypothetical protein